MMTIRVYHKHRMFYSLNILPWNTILYHFIPFFGFPFLIFKFLNIIYSKENSSRVGKTRKMASKNGNPVIDWWYSIFNEQVSLLHKLMPCEFNVVAKLCHALVFQQFYYLACLWKDWWSLMLKIHTIEIQIYQNEYIVFPYTLRSSCGKYYKG